MVIPQESRQLTGINIKGLLRTWSLKSGLIGGSGYWRKTFDTVGVVL